MFCNKSIQTWNTVIALKQGSDYQQAQGNMCFSYSVFLAVDFE